MQTQSENCLHTILLHPSFIPPFLVLLFQPHMRYFWQQKRKDAHTGPSFPTTCGLPTNILAGDVTHSLQIKKVPKKCHPSRWYFLTLHSNLNNVCREGQLPHLLCPSIVPAEGDAQKSITALSYHNILYVVNKKSLNIDL